MADASLALQHCGACGNDVWPASELGVDGNFRGICPKCGSGMQAEVIPLPVAARPEPEAPVSRPAPAARPAPAQRATGLGPAETQYITAALAEVEEMAAAINDRIRRIKALVQ